MLYAAYGSNLHPVRLQERTPSARLLGTSVVTGWRLVFNKRGQDGSGKCNIVEASGEVRVAVYELSRGDKQALDRIEGLNKGYEACTLTVTGFGDCGAYVASSSHVDRLVLPYSWYKGLVLAGCSYHGFATQYRATIERVPHCQDADQSRHERFTQLCERLHAALAGQLPR